MQIIDESPFIEMHSDNRTMEPLHQPRKRVQMLDIRFYNQTYTIPALPPIINS